MKPLFQLFLAVINTMPGFRLLPSDNAGIARYEFVAADKTYIVMIRVAEWIRRVRIDCLLKRTLPAGSTTQVVEFLRNANRDLMYGCVDYCEEEESIIYSETWSIDQSMMQSSYVEQLLVPILNSTIQFDRYIDMVLSDEEEAAESFSESLNANNYLCGISTN